MKKILAQTTIGLTTIRYEEPGKNLKYVTIQFKGQEKRIVSSSKSTATISHDYVLTVQSFLESYLNSDNSKKEEN